MALKQHAIFLGISRTLMIKKEIWPWKSKLPWAHLQQLKMLSPTISWSAEHYLQSYTPELHLNLAH